jgi:flavin-binding protein dodecin
MSDIAKIIEVVGSSDRDWADAADQAVRTASETVSGITGVEVKHMTATVEDGKITRFKATVKIAFGVKG